MYLILGTLGPGVYSASKRNEYQNKQTPWSESASKLYRPSDRRLLAKWLPTCADRRCHMVSVTDPTGRILGFSRQEPLLFYQAAPQLYSQGWVDSVPDPLLFFLPPPENLVVRESNPGLRICSQELWPLDHRGGRNEYQKHRNNNVCDE
jgi:hypothetical protein